MANPIRLAATSGPYLDAVPIDVSSVDADLTDPSGPTGGYCCRAIYVGTGGTVVFKGLGLPNPGAGYTLENQTVTVADATIFNACAQFISKDGTASGMMALL